MTLEQLGEIYGCTRERIRQLERKFWRKITHPTIEVRSSLVAALLADLMHRRGSLLLDSDQPETSFTHFLAKCLGIPYARTRVKKFALLGLSEDVLTGLSPIYPLSEATDSNLLAERLDCGVLSNLGRSDLNELAQAITESRFEQLNKTEKVYLALRNIGKPAHFSEVAEAYNALFPNDQMPERNVHAVLSRCAEPNAELHGIVWIRVKGTYALKENGYERPELGIYEAVAKIVQDRYVETGRPAHLNVITTELGKQRPVVNPASLALATGANPYLEQVAKDYFVPKDPQQEAKTEEAANDLDSILREFRATHSEGI